MFWRRGIGGWGASWIGRKVLDKHFAKGQQDALAGRWRDPGIFAESTAARYLRMAYDAGYYTNRKDRKDSLWDDHENLKYEVKKLAEQVAYAHHQIDLLEPCPPRGQFTPGGRLAVYREDMYEMWHRQDDQ